MFIFPGGLPGKYQFQIVAGLNGSYIGYQKTVTGSISPTPATVDGVEFQSILDLPSSNRCFMYFPGDAFAGGLPTAIRVYVNGAYLFSMAEPTPGDGNWGYFAGYCGFAAGNTYNIGLDLVY